MKRRQPYWKIAEIPAERYYKTQWANRRLPKDAIAIGETAEGGAVYITPADLSTHVHVMGPTGAGKSKLLELIARRLIDRKREALIVLDPNEDLVQDIKAYVHAAGQTDRLLFVDLHRYGDPIVSFNPMLARSGSVAAHASRDVQVLMRVWGQQEFISTPRMGKWLFNVFYALRSAGATYREALELLDPQVPGLARALVRILPPEDPIRSEWGWIQDTATPTVRKEHLDSAHSRIKGFLLNDLVKDMVGQVERNLDPGRIIDEGKILLVNLQEGAEITAEDSRLLGTLFFSAFTREAISRPRSRRVPFTLIADEFYRFISSEAVGILATGRKYLCSLILAHQYPYQLIDAGSGVLDQSALHAVVECTRTKVVFGDLSPDQYRDIAEKIAVKTFDPYKVKQEMHVLRQIVDGFAEVTTRGTTASRSRGTSIGTSMPFSLDALGGLDMKEYGTRGEVEQDSESVAESEHTGFLPTYKTFSELTSREYVSYNEHLLGILRVLIDQPDQHGCLIRKRHPATLFRVADVTTPAISEDRIEELDRLVLAAPGNPYTSIRLVKRNIEERRKRILEEGAAPPSEDLEVPKAPAAAPLTVEQARLLAERRKPPSSTPRDSHRPRGRSQKR